MRMERVFGSSCLWLLTDELDFVGSLLFGFLPADGMPCSGQDLGRSSADVGVAVDTCGLSGVYGI